MCNGGLFLAKVSPSPSGFTSLPNFKRTDMNYRWDFPLKNMDKPTSEKDVIKSLPTDEEVHRKYALHHLQKRYNGVKAIVWEADPSAADIKPVFDKMLAALKDLNELPGLYISPDWDQRLKAAIKEAEELGL